MYCLNCEKKDKKAKFLNWTEIEHVGSISFDLKEYRCDCKFGSWYRFSGKWKNLDKKCRHCKAAIKKIMEKRKNGVQM